MLAKGNYLTRNGRVAVVTHQAFADEKSVHPLRGFVLTPAGPDRASWTAGGLFVPGESSDYDLTHRLVAVPLAENRGAEK